MPSYFRLNLSYIVRAYRVDKFCPTRIDNQNSLCPTESTVFKTKTRSRKYVCGDTVIALTSI